MAYERQIVTCINSVATVEVVAAEVLKGSGTPSDPYTSYTQFWTINNHFIGEIPTNEIPNYLMRHCIS